MGHNDCERPCSMKPRIYSVLAIALLALMFPCGVLAQSEDNATPLGDIARALRNKKAPEQPQKVVIDNDNLGKVMEQGEADHLKGRINFALAGSNHESRISSPDVTCSLSFNAQSAEPVSDTSIAQDLPHADLIKLDGPAVINGDALDLTVYNATGWNLREITVGLTIVRRSDNSAAYYGSARLLPASAGAPASTEKHADMTVLYHIKGTAAPFSTAVFHQSLGAALGPDQDWHWAIVQAQGLPPKE
jgi:hypothetical protein